MYYLKNYCRELLHIFVCDNIAIWYHLKIICIFNISKKTVTLQVSFKNLSLVDVDVANDAFEEECDQLVFEQNYQTCKLPNTSNLGNQFSKTSTWMQQQLKKHVCLSWREKKNMNWVIF